MRVSDEESRCRVCDAAYALGQRLPKMKGYDFVKSPPSPDHAGDAVDTLPPPWRMLLHSSDKRKGADAKEIFSSFTFVEEEANSGAVFRRRAHVPRISDPHAPRYEHLGLNAETEERVEAGDVMTFGHIAAEALEERAGGGFMGRALLGIIKADVDRLGQVFGWGLGSDRSPARIAQLSRLIDAYFTIRLPWLLEREFRSTYTVYAGGDDLLLVSPWRQALPLALRLHEDFSAFSSENPNLTLSMGIAFVHPKHPLALAVEEAEEALKEAKNKGRNRLGVFDRTLSWDELRATLSLAEELHRHVCEGTLPPTFLYRIRRFAFERSRAEGGDTLHAGWNAKWSYHRKRFLDGRFPWRMEEEGKREEKEKFESLFTRCLPPPGQKAEGDTELAATVALWRNR